jgi:hypothetical protein
MKINPDDYTATPPMPALAELLDGGIHLEITCLKCGAHKRLKAPEACALLGAGASILAARRRVNCGCGARGRDKEIQVYPSTEDDSARRHLEATRQAHAEDANALTTSALANAEAQWARLQAWDGVLPWPAPPWADLFPWSRWQLEAALRKAGQSN